VELLGSIYWLFFRRDCFCNWRDNICEDLLLILGHLRKSIANKISRNAAGIYHCGRLSG